MDGLVHKGSMDDISSAKVLCAETSSVDIGGWRVGLIPAERGGEGASPLFELEVEFAGDGEGAVSFGGGAADICAF